MIKQIGINLTKQTLKNIRIYQFSKDAWKDKQDSAQKIYINKTQKEALKKLLSRVQEQEINFVEKNQEFNRQLRQILKRYRIDNPSFQAEVINIHKTL